MLCITVTDNIIEMWQLQLSALLLVAIFQVSAQTVNSTLPVNKEVCPGERIIFTCVVHGLVLAWSSEEYIGSGGTQIEFAIIDKINKTIPRLNAIAKLVNISESGGAPVIESQLEIISSAAGSVVCHDVSAGTLQSIHFNVIGECH